MTLINIPLPRGLSGLEVSAAVRLSGFHVDCWSVIERKGQNPVFAANVAYGGPFPVLAERVADALHLTVYNGTEGKAHNAAYTPEGMNLPAVPAWRMVAPVVPTPGPLPADPRAEPFHTATENLAVASRIAQNPVNAAVQADLRPDAPTHHQTPERVDAVSDPTGERLFWLQDMWARNSAFSWSEGPAPITNHELRRLLRLVITGAE